MTARKIEWAETSSLDKINLIALEVMEWESIEGGFADHDQKRIAWNFNPLERCDHAAQIIDRLFDLGFLVEKKNRFEPRDWEVIAYKPEVATPGMPSRTFYAYAPTEAEAICKAALRMAGFDVQDGQQERQR